MAQNASLLLKTVLVSIVVTCVVVVTIQLMTRWLTGRNSSLAVSIGIPVALTMVWTWLAVLRKRGRQSS